MDYVHNGGSRDNINKFFEIIYGQKPNFLVLNDILYPNSRILLYEDNSGIYDSGRCSSEFGKD